LGEPNDNHGVVETCVDFKVYAGKSGNIQGDEFLLNDESCLTLLSYICQTTIATCKEGEKLC